MIPTQLHRRYASRMLAELDGGWLHVIKVPGRHGGYIRVVCSHNADWYRDFCRRFEHGRLKRRYRKPRTVIRRCHTRKALEHLVAGKNSTLYSGRLMEFIEAYFDHETTGERK
jgi:hypothetical protein